MKYWCNLWASDFLMPEYHSLLPKKDRSITRFTLFIFRKGYHEKNIRKQKRFIKHYDAGW